MMMLRVSLCVWTFIAVIQADLTPPPNEDLPLDPEEGDPLPTEGLPMITTAPPDFVDDIAIDPEQGGEFICPDGWEMHSTQCLLYVPQNLTWEAAKENCMSSGGGSLASVFSGSDALDIHDVMKDAGQTTGKVWVGGYRPSENSPWAWDNDPMQSQVSGFCDSAQGNNCLEVTFAGENSGCLEDMDCGAELPSVCGIILM